ncbi:hypothetical protein [Streptomyces sp. NPDC006552]|uniref:hypothetical protein n=1 Tax=Streptomyces sp. NPDC006552 TaxID=3157179 RepID=UPI0033A1A326
MTAVALGVSWAADIHPAPAWLDIAREFTEHWTHRQQIRPAIGRNTDPEPRALTVIVNTIVRALFDFSSWKWEVLPLDARPSSL